MIICFFLLFCPTVFACPAYVRELSFLCVRPLSSPIVVFLLFSPSCISLPFIPAPQDEIDWSYDSQLNISLVNPDQVNLLMDFKGGQLGELHVSNLRYMP